MEAIALLNSSPDSVKPGDPASLALCFFAVPSFHFIGVDASINRTTRRGPRREQRAKSKVRQRDQCSLAEGEELGSNILRRRKLADTREYSKSQELACRDVQL